MGRVADEKEGGQTDWSRLLGLFGGDTSAWNFPACCATAAVEKHVASINVH